MNGDKLFPSAEIFRLDLPGKLLAGKVHWLYSPLTRTSVLIDGEELEEVLTSPENSEIFHSLADGIEEERSRLQHTPMPWDRLVIVPNTKCNFSCSYCYSRAGRNNREITPEICERAIDSFWEAVRPEKIFKLGIVGGGEPLLSPEILKKLIRYAGAKAAAAGVVLQVDVSTNGSLADDDFLDFVRQYNIGIGVSFDIIPELQNRQRGHYETVAGNIRKMLRSGITPGIKATITPDAAARQEEMVMEIAKNFPGIRHLVLQLVVDPELLPDTAAAEKFYSDALDSFFRAVRAGKRCGIQVQNTLSAHAGMLVNRFCPGEYCVTPEGFISACDFFTSSIEDGLEHFCYGKISPDGSKIAVDQEKWENIRQENLFSHPECQDCFAKYHCGGACTYIRRTLPPKYFAVHCRYIREFFRTELFQRFSDELKKQCGKSAGELLQSQEIKELFG